MTSSSSASPAPSAPVTAQDLGPVGIWSAAVRTGQSADGDARIADAVAELDDLGFGTVWIGGNPSVGQALPLLKASRRIRVATGILSIWDHPAEEVAPQAASAGAEYGGRFVLGLGVSHGPTTPQYAKPYSAMKEYLSALDSASTPLPAGRRVLAALGPKMLRLATERAAGAHPYLVTEEHVAQAREALGDGAVLAPELKVVLDTDLARAREKARAYASMYLALPNYTNNLLRLGFTEDEFENGGSDRLLDAVFALGDADRVRERVAAFRAAGADHVALQAVTDDPFNSLPSPEWRALADALDLGGSR